MCHRHPVTRGWGVEECDESESALNADLAKMAEYYSRWRLQPSVTKTVSSVFHLNNFSASKELSVYLNGQRLKHDPHRMA